MLDHRAPALIVVIQGNNFAPARCLRAQEEIRALHEKEKDLQRKIKGLEREIAAHKREIKYRDDTIGEKEKKIYELKKKNQEVSSTEQPRQDASPSICLASHNGLHVNIKHCPLFTPSAGEIQVCP